MQIGRKRSTGNVPDYQLSIAIDKEGMNARLAAKLTGYKIDTRVRHRPREMGLFEEMDLDNQMADTSYEGYQEEPQNNYHDGYEDYQEENKPE